MAALQVFRPVVAEGFEWVQPVDETDFDAVYQLDGTPRASGWKPIRVRRLQADDKGRPWQPADLPWLGGHALVLRERACQALGELLGQFGELLELDLVDDLDRLWLFNVCSVVDGLDQDASKVVRFPSTGRVMKINQHAFRTDRIAGDQVFRIPEARSLFLTGGVVQAIENAGLSGAAFELVWDSPVVAST